MQNETRFHHAQMVSPSAGFTARVMARLEERERARARQRAMIGVGLLVAAAVAFVAVTTLWVAAWINALLASPSAILATVQTISPLLGGLAEALWIAAAAILRAVNSVQMLAYALIVLALTAIWARVVTHAQNAGASTGPSKFALTLSVGGQRK